MTGSRDRESSTFCLIGYKELIEKLVEKLIKFFLILNIFSTWNQITIAAEGLQGKVSSVTMNGAALTAIGYSYNTMQWETSPLIILEDPDGEIQPSLHKTYDIVITYMDE